MASPSDSGGRFGAIRRLTQMNPASLVTPVTPPKAPEETPWAPVWQLLVARWRQPSKGSFVDVLRRGMPGRKAMPEVADAIVLDMVKAFVSEAEPKAAPFDGVDRLMLAYDQALSLRATLEALVVEGEFSADGHRGLQLTTMLDGLLVELRTRVT